MLVSSFVSPRCENCMYRYRCSTIVHSHASMDLWTLAHFFFNLDMVSFNVAVFKVWGTSGEMHCEPEKIIVNIWLAKFSYVWDKMDPFHYP